MTTGYLAAEGLEEPLLTELENITAQHGRLILADGPPQKAYWAQNIWHDPQIIPFQSISDAAKKLRSLGGLWMSLPYKNIRRSELITASLPYFSPKPLPFGAPAPKTPLGSWTLLDNETLLASPRCSSPFPHGEARFDETKEPPGRAYLKLWECFARTGFAPKPNELCLEIGASPGSWTWVLHQLKTRIIAIDRAPLDPALARHSNISFLKKDAFTHLPDNQVDWVFSDVICYPEKLLGWIQKWLEAKVDANFVCTLKFQGKEGYGIIKEFEKIEGSQILHLFHNKHELTWIKKKVKRVETPTS